MTTPNRLSDLDVFRVDIVDRAAVRDPAHPTQPARFLAWKSESHKENSMPNVITTKLAAALAKAADNESALDAFIAKDEINAEAAAAVKAAFRLLSTAKAALTPEGMAEMAKAMGIDLELLAKAAFPGAAPPFGGAKPHTFQPKSPADGTCGAADCGAGGTAAVHAVDSAGASGSKAVEAAAKAEEVVVEPVIVKADAEPTEEVIKSELAKLPEAVRLQVEKAIESAAKAKDELEKSEKANLEKADVIAKAEVAGIVSKDMGHVPGIAPAALIDLLHNLRKSDSKTFDSILPILKSTSEAVKTSDVLKVAGSPAAGTASDVLGQIGQIAKGIEKAEGLSAAKSKAAAWERNPELHRQYNAEQAARVAVQP